MCLSVMLQVIDLFGSGRTAVTPNYGTTVGLAYPKGLANISLSDADD
jgi:hypothetical protein